MHFGQFDKYFKVKLYTFNSKHIMSQGIIEEKNKFIKEIVENSVVPEVHDDADDEDMNERHQELSNYGSMGRAASVRSSKNYR